MTHRHKYIPIRVAYKADDEEIKNDPNCVFHQKCEKLFYFLAYQGLNFIYKIDKYWTCFI